MRANVNRDTASLSRADTKAVNEPHGINDYCGKSLCTFSVNWCFTTFDNDFPHWLFYPVRKIDINFGKIPVGIYTALRFSALMHEYYLPAERIAARIEPRGGPGGAIASPGPPLGSMSRAASNCDARANLAYAQPLPSEPKSTISSLARSTMASKPGLRSLRGS